MACGCSKRKKKLSQPALQTNMNNSGPTPLGAPMAAPYDFASDDDFVKVLNNTQSTRIIPTIVMSPRDFKLKYQTQGYGPKVSGQEFYMLRDDVVAYEGSNVVQLEIVEDEPVVVEAVIIEDDEDELEVVDLTSVKGIGKSTAEKLNGLGYNSVNELANLTLDEWTSLNKFNNETNYNTLMESVKEVLDR